MDGKVTSNSRCSKWRFSWSSSRKCWRAKRVCSFRYGKHFRTAELGSGNLKGRCVSMFYCYPKSMSNLSSICRASFWWGSIQLAIGHESAFKDYSSLCVSLSCLWLSTCTLTLMLSVTYPILVHMACQYPRQKNTEPCIYYRHQPISC
jgi:hypothetical protein